MTASSLEKLSFLVSWEDSVSGMCRNFLLTFYPGDSSVEMMDMRTKKIFLKKTPTDQISRSDLYLGNSVLLFSRRLHIKDFGDEVTRNNCVTELESTLGVVMPGGLHQGGHLMAEAQKAGFTLARARLVHLTELQASNFLDKFRGDADFPEMVTRLTVGPLLVMELVGEGAVAKWKQLVGNHPEDQSIVQGSSTIQDARIELEFFFPKSRLLPTSLLTPGASWQEGQLQDYTCCIVKPHIFHKAGEIIAALQEEGFRILGLQTFLLNFGQAEEFLEVYKGVVDEYGEMVTQLSSGQCLVLQLGVGDQEHPVSRLRELCGPPDPVTAKLVRPKSLRARFGVTLVQNAVHCTDLPEDAELDIQYFFSVLQ